MLSEGIVRGGLVIKHGFMQGQPIYSGYFEPAGCGTIGQAWVTAGAVAVSLTALLCLERLMLLSPWSLLLMMMMRRTVELEYVLF